jgi:hypothetical protein
LKGDDLYKAGNYVAAIEEYTEGVKRDPNNKNIYSNRS